MIEEWTVGLSAGGLHSPSSLSVYRVVQQNAAQPAAVFCTNLHKVTFFQLGPLHFQLTALPQRLMYVRNFVSNDDWRLEEPDFLTDAYR